MLNSIANTTQTAPPVQAPAKPSVASSSKPSASKVHAPQPATDTVQLSLAAQSLQEATETAAQTQQEAVNGDRQARAILAKEYPPKAAGA